MITSEMIAIRSKENWRRAKAERLAKREYGKNLERLDLSQWRDIWRRVDALEAFENGGQQ